MILPRPAAWLIARPVLSLVGLAVLLGLILVSVHSCQKLLQAPAAARLAAQQDAAASDNAKDAIASQAGAQEREQASDTLTRENEHAIRTATGADAPVDPAVRDAGLAGLCKRAAYLRDPKCLRFTSPAAMETGGAGHASAGR